MERLRESHVEFDGWKNRQCSYKLAMFWVATLCIFLRYIFLSFLVFSPFCSTGWFSLCLHRIIVLVASNDFQLWLAWEPLTLPQTSQPLGSLPSKLSSLSLGSNATLGQIDR